MIFIAANAASYVSERRAYYQFLEESGWDWAGAWTWGVPFTIVVAGLGHDNHSQMAPLGFALNVIVWLIAAGFVGVFSELMVERFRSKSE